MNLVNQVKTTAQNIARKVNRTIRAIFHSFVFSTSLTVLLATFVAFGFGSADSRAATSSGAYIIGQPQTQIATIDQSNGLMNRAEAMSKNVEGKVQEAIGKATGNSKNQVVGKAKQAESQAMNLAEDVKDRLKDVVK